jgi:nucleoside 2-deoxyribosyltransferase
LPKGYERIDLLQKNIAKNTKNVFIAMSFAPEMANVRNAIKSALLECGFVPRIMDEIEHNHQIVPEMLYEIREARFVIAELTGHNNGAYFEAGYALGFGKEVIQVCQKSKFGDDGHFDVKQINSVLWEDTDDLTRKLISRIKATIA